MAKRKIRYVYPDNGKRIYLPKDKTRVAKGRYTEEKRVKEPLDLTFCRMNAYLGPKPGAAAVALEKAVNQNRSGMAPCLKGRVLPKAGDPGNPVVVSEDII